MRIIVIGAGASGLAFALESIHHGLKVRIVEKRTARSTIGKATGVSLGTWGLLNKFGISIKICSNAIAMSNFCFYDNEKKVANISVPYINGYPPAYLYPQTQLEQLMEQELNRRGVFIEYGVEITDIKYLDGSKNLDNQCEQFVEASLYHHKNEYIEKTNVNWIVGADGAHSNVRKIIQVPFIGRDYPETWSVAEAETRLWQSDVQAKLYLQTSGVGLFLSQPIKGRVQGILNSMGVVDAMKKILPDAKILYERKFSVSLRRVVSPRDGRVWLIGDAAHVQSPIGGQGLNLAIWDGITLAKGLLTSNLKIEATLAKRAKRILMFTDFDYRMLVSKNNTIRFLRNKFWVFAEKYPYISKWFFKIISGVGS